MDCARPALGRLSIDENVYPGGACQSPHEHPFASLTLVLAGSLAETVGGVTEEAGPLSVVVKPPLVRHADRMGPQGARTLRLCLEPDEHAALAQWGVRLDSWRWVHGGPIARALLGLAATARAGSREGLEPGVYDALAHLADPVTLASCPPRWLSRVRQAIDDQIVNVLRVRKLASEAGVHPVYLARQFRRFYGCSVTAYLRRRRACAAAALIGSSSLGLADVAQRSGYADHAHLSRDFKGLVGVSPSVFRALAADD